MSSIMEDARRKIRESLGRADEANIQDVDDVNIPRVIVSGEDGELIQLSERLEGIPTVMYTKKVADMLSIFLQTRDTGTARKIVEFHMEDLGLTESKIEGVEVAEEKSDKEKSKKAIKDLAKKSYAKDNEQNAAAQMLLGLANSSAEISDKFWAILDKKLDEIPDELDLDEED